MVKRFFLFFLTLVECLYKIIAKLLAARLKNVLGGLISHYQSAFVYVRQLLDGVLIVNVIVDDCVNRDFLRFMMAKMNFGSIWMDWMEACKFKSHLSILINGNPKMSFKVGRGLRHGDPLSPFLFVVIAGGLTCLIKNASDI